MSSCGDAEGELIWPLKLCPSIHAAGLVVRAQHEPSQDGGGVGEEEEGGEAEESTGKDGTRFFSLREREEIAKWAYMTWLRHGIFALAWCS